MSASAFHRALVLGTVGLAVMALGTAQAQQPQEPCDDGRLPTHDQLQSALQGAVASTEVGLGNEMWGTVVDRDGIVCQVAFSSNDDDGDRGDQWPGSRVISAQKANTANAFSLEGEYPNLLGVGRALASGNLYGTVLEQGNLFGLQFSNPVNPTVAYQGPPQNFGQEDDPMVDNAIGGVNVFGGGLALYAADDGTLLGGLGVSGDTSCTDHIIAWKARFLLNLDNIPGGVADGTDNLIIPRREVTPNTFEHPSCGFGEDPVIAALPDDFPIGPDPAP